MSTYHEFKTPGLYNIVNETSGLYLTLGMAMSSSPGTLPDYVLCLACVFGNLSRDRQTLIAQQRFHHHSAIQPAVADCGRRRRQVPHHQQKDRRVRFSLDG